MLYRNLPLQWSLDTDDHFAKDRSSHKTPRDPLHCHNATKMKWSVQNRCEPYHSSEIMASKNATSSAASLTSQLCSSQLEKLPAKIDVAVTVCFGKARLLPLQQNGRARNFERKFIVTEERTQYNGHFARMMYVGTDATKERTHATCWNNTSASLLHM